NSVTIMTVNVIDSRSEAAVRTALGASFRRVIRPYVIEAVTLSVCAGLLAVVATGWTIPLVRRGVPPGIAKWIAGWDAVRPDASLAMTTWCIAAAIGVGIGVWSGVRGARGNLVASIAADGRTVGRASGRGREAALAIQACVSIMLLSAAVLFHGGLGQVRSAFGAFDPDHVLLARTNAPPHQFPSDTDVVSFFERAAAAGGTLYGVDLAGLVRNAPASNVPSPTLGVWSTDEPPAAGTPAPTADVQIADPRGLAALGVPIVSGRAFLDSDTSAASRVALVSRQLANRVWGDREPLGRVLAIDDGSRWRVVGVVEDVRLNWYDGGPRPTIYLPHAQTAARSMTLVLRAGTGRPETLARPLVAALRSVEPGPPPLRTYTLRQEVDDSLAPLMTIAWLLAALALVALGLAAADMYALAASVVALRTREIGIRMALGAAPRSLARLVLRAVAWPVALGAALGVPASAGLARWLGAHTFGLLALDPFVPVAIGALLMAAAALGAGNPALRAARIDPVVTLRQ
ncbi:MAG TPA: FtsX-like permease family protein, partial [Vicinamibacterales bacterium]|nr:FtsX-like permease family protein [Vicinamibacterales bacterium]